MEAWEYPIRANCHRYEGRTQAVYKEDENGKQSVARNFSIFMKCLLSSRTQRSRTWTQGNQRASTAGMGTGGTEEITTFEAGYNGQGKAVA